MTKCDGRITKNFALSELANKLANEEVELVITPEFIDFIRRCQKLRDTLAAIYPAEYSIVGLIVSSCYRTKQFNALVGGDGNSAHLVGRAMDITSIRVEHYPVVEWLWRGICEREGVVGGINFYKDFIHITDNEDRFGHKQFAVRDLR